MFISDLGLYLFLCGSVPVQHACVQYFGAWAIFDMDACHVFPQGVPAIILLGEEGVCVCVCVCVCVFGVMVTRARSQCWVEPSPCSLIVTALLGAGFAPQL